MRVKTKPLYSRVYDSFLLQELSSVKRDTVDIFQRITLPQERTQYPPKKTTVAGETDSDTSTDTNGQQQTTQTPRAVTQDVCHLLFVFEYQTYCTFLH